MAVQDNITHVEISAPHNKCAASKYTNGSLPFGTFKTLSNVISQPHRLSSSGKITVLFFYFCLLYFYGGHIDKKSPVDTGAINEIY